MRLTAFMLLVACQISASGLSQKISLSQKEVRLEKLLQEIEVQSGFSFLYNQKIMEGLPTMSLKVRNVSLQEALDLCFANLPLTYKLIDSTVVIKRNIVPLEETLLLAPIGVKGTVVDKQSGNVVVGASINIKGTSKGTTTDKFGKFELYMPAASVLVITNIGFEPQEIQVDKPGYIKVELLISNKSMNEMVVTGMFSRPKANFTGASTSFTQEDIKKVSATNIFKALSTLDASFQLIDNINAGSNPNVMPDIVIRGGNSLVDIGGNNNNDIFNYASSPNAPLFILDGFEVSLQRIRDLDMNRVAKVDILKDAAATSIYGSKAANGVVVIETVAPVSGKMRLSLTGTLDVQAPDLTVYDLLNAREKLQLEKEAGVYESAEFYTLSQLDQYYNQRLSEVEKGVNTYWLSQPLRTPLSHNYRLLVEGGSDKVTYTLGGSYISSEGVMKGSGRKTMSGNFRLVYRTRNVLFSNDLDVSFNNSRNSSYGDFAQYGKLNPYFRPYDEATRELNYYLEPLTSTLFPKVVNPLYNGTLNVVNKGKYTGLTNNFSVNWQATNWLRIVSNFSASKSMDEFDDFLPAQHTSFAATALLERGRYTKSYGNSVKLQGNISANISQLIGKHMIFSTLFASINDQANTTQNYTVIGFPNDRMDQLTMGLKYPDNTKPGGTENLSRNASLTSNFSYAYDNRYLFDLSGRLDASSQFGSNKRTAPFWSVGLGWNVHKEPALNLPSSITQLKLRYTYGNTGSQNFASYLGISTSDYFTNGNYRGLIGTSLKGYGNPDLSWQMTYKTNFGIDLSLFNRLELTANYFVENTKGSIGVVSTPLSVGFLNYSDNIGDLKGQGWEGRAAFRIISKPGKRDNWTVFVNALHTESRISKVSNTIKQINQNNATIKTNTPLPRYAEGEKLTAIWAVQSLGIDPSTGAEIYLSRDGKLTNIYNPIDQVKVGDVAAKVQGSVGTNFEYNGFGCTINFRFKYGGQIYNTTLVNKVEGADIKLDNVDRRVYEERWMKPGDKTFFKGLKNLSGTIDNTTYATSRFVADENYLANSNITVSYRLKDSLNKRLGLSNSMISLYTNDLFRLSSVKMERGLEYPFSRSFTLQFTTTF